MDLELNDFQDVWFLMVVEYLDSFTILLNLQPKD